MHIVAVATTASTAAVLLCEDVLLVTYLSNTNLIVLGHTILVYTRVLVLHSVVILE